ncbi:hypothetical protein [Deinococcus soli (ex Cha et al. 2016)]|uniref:Uncharacterized protein n=2 Tax=Deinococcus soli (ex Cha et al. 2016) TaxID=1309411 RepID=A0ACC6KKE4_9DEIO|nr:hypothetical protein [Deinococcus soli (ex Cha et al. 2016)]MDR6218671.1 hypothetical protein [Deinococcus soli (ex Cha et al. 2016)]MDR6328468.1 hypothetical protein [Deinococcus soli (ex Cha et al. 2016)]MDR6753079.1 hypothetical protein [Deinococcus soli (ex Cha et al. 2016)]
MAQHVTLNPDTTRFKQLIKQHGARGWTVLERRAHVICLGNRPGLRVRAPGGTYERWVEPHHVTP